MLFLIVFKLVWSISQMSPHRGGEWGGGGWDTALQDFSQLHKRPKGSFLAVNPTKFCLSIPDIIIYLAGHFQPISHSLASTSAIKEHLCIARQATEYPWGKQTEEELTVK